MANPMIKKSHRGLLHKKLGVPPGSKIGASKLATAKKTAKATGNASLMKEVTFAQNFGHKAPSDSFAKARGMMKRAYSK